jgi:hypothetical protein
MHRFNKEIIIGTSIIILFALLILFIDKTALLTRFQGLI